MAGRKNGLGRGLDAFFPDRTSVVKEPARKTITKTVKTEKKSDVAEKQTNPTVAKKQTADSKTGAMIVKISSVEPNMDQPRKQFDEDALMELSESIKQYGVLHPLLVSDKKDYYEIVAGERRWRAAKKANLKEIPAVIRKYSEEQVAEIALIENLQRENLNPIEEAIGYNLLMDEFNLTQELISQRVGKSRSAIANSLRLLSLEDEIQKMLILGTLTSGHARAILSLDDKELRIALSKRIIEDNLNVRQAEALAKQLQKKKPQKKKSEKTAYDIEIEKIQNTLSSAMGTKVRINHTAKKGKIEIEYYGNEDLERVLGFFNIKGE